jgi:iron complex outermembrane receptor protein
MNTVIARRYWPGTLAIATLPLGVAVLLTAAAPARSQENVDAAPDRRVIEEIVVTARRREESLQAVPGSVSALDHRRIEELQADDLSELQYSVPNLYFERGDGANAVVFIRGIGQNDSLAFADPGVGVYVDDVFVARSQAAFLDLFDVERVEVLRGPQGTLYGRNTIGGAIKFVSRPPPDEFDLYTEVGSGNFDFATLKGRIGGPLAGRALTGKIAVAAANRDGYATNLVTGADDGDQSSLAWRAALAYTPGDRFELLFSVDGKRARPDSSRSPVRETSVAGFADPVGAPTTMTVFAPSNDPYGVGVNANGWSDLTSDGLTLKAGWTWPSGWSLESITGYRQMGFDLILDTDGTPLPVLDILVRQDQEQLSQELRASYESSRLNVVGGVYYFHDDDLTFSGVDNAAVSVFGFPVTAFGLATSSLADTQQKTESIAVFADLTYALTERLDLSLGVRYTAEDKEATRRFENFFDPALSVVHDTPPFLTGAGVAGTPVTGKQDFDALTPKLIVSYQPREQLLLYASAARGFKSGGFDGRGTTDFQFQPFEPETVWGYEAGLKSTLADGRLVANAALFRNDYEDMQVTSFGADPVSGTFQSLFTNAAKARIQGVELDLIARPLANLDVYATLGYLDARYEEFEILVGGVVTDVSDRELVNAPEWSASLGTTYEHSLTASLIGSAHVDAAYRGKTYNEITASELLAADSYGLVNAWLGLRGDDDRWELRAGVQNLTDREIRVQGFNLSEFPGYQLGFYSAPRTYDLRLFYRY